MNTRSPQAGGCLLILCILIGLVVGFWTGQVSYYVMIGTGLGALLAIAIWLVDRRR
jgi:uncharacterized membrane protein